MKLIRAFIFLLFISYAASSNSADWYEIPGTDWQGDWSRIRYDSAGNITIWIKSVTPPDLIAQIQHPENYRDYQYTMNYWVVNCKQETFFIQQGVYYGKGGRVISSYTNPNNFQVVTPESNGEAVFKAVCPKEKVGRQ